MKVPGTQQQETAPETKVEETNETAPPAAPEAPADSVSETAPSEEVTDKVPEQSVGAFVDQRPCNWFVRPDEEVEGLIEASNSVSREHFRGTIAEFNAALRG